jgi:hypothetical protein
MADAKVVTGGSLLSRLDTFQKLVAIAGAIITGWGAYVTIHLGNIDSKLTNLKEERVWAKELYSQFDAIVSKEADEQARIDRLAGLLALSELSDEKQFRAQWGTLIRKQASRYESALLSRAPSPEVTAQLQQYRALRQDAAASVVQANPVFSNYDFDIFWCPGEANRAAAQEIANLKKQDPSASGNWRLRPVKGGGSWIADKKPFSIVWDYEDEKPIAEALGDKIDGLKLIQGTALRRLRSTTLGTRWYLSVFVCQS